MQDVLKLKANLLPQPLKCLDYREESLHPPTKHFFKVLNTRENNEDKWTNIAEKGDAQGEWTYSSGEPGGTPTTLHTLGVCTGQSCQWRKRAQWPHGAGKTNPVMRNFKIQDFGKKAAAETETKRYFGVP